MRVARYYSANDIRIEEQAAPEPGPGEIVVEVAACGICGSDLMPWYLERRAPLVIGHEPAGTVVAVGAGVRDFRPGDRVFVHHHVPCFVCHDCRRGHHSLCPTFHATNIDPGGLAERIRVPALNVERDVLHLPDSLSYEAATLIEPLACALRGVKIAAPHPGDTLAIVGSGVSGLLTLTAARRWHPRRVAAFDRSPFRLEAAQALGANAVFSVDAPDVAADFRAWNAGRGADVVFVCAGATAAIALAFALVGKGGTVLLYAPPPPGETVPLDPNRVFFEELSIKGAYSTSPFETREALDMLLAGEVDVDRLITHRLPLAETGPALKMAAVAGESLKIVIDPRR